jgi:putative endonuclease
MSAFVYMIQCSDRSYYVGSTRTTLDDRIVQLSGGSFDGYTARRRPVTLVFAQEFDRITDAIAAERQLKGWRRAKKEALIRGDFEALQQRAKAYSQSCSTSLRPSTSSG